MSHISSLKILSGVSLVEDKKAWKVCRAIASSINQDNDPTCMNSECLRNRAHGLGLGCPRPKVAAQGHPARGPQAQGLGGPGLQPRGWDNLIGWHQIWVGDGPVDGQGRVPRPASGPGSYPLALGHQLGMTSTKAPLKFSTYVIINNINTCWNIQWYTIHDHMTILHRFHHVSFMHTYTMGKWVWGHTLEVYWPVYWLTEWLLYMSGVWGSAPRKFGKFTIKLCIVYSEASGWMKVLVIYEMIHQGWMERWGEGCHEIFSSDLHWSQEWSRWAPKKPESLKSLKEADPCNHATG